MEAASVYVKTQHGRAEVHSRARRLSPRERATLIMIDGQRCLAELRRLSSAPQEVEHHLRAFLQAGLIIPLPASLHAPPSQTGSSAYSQPSSIPSSDIADAALERARDYVMEVAQETLGAQAPAFIDQLTRLGNAQELLQLAQRLREVLSRFASAQEADQFWETVREILPKN